MKKNKAIFAAVASASAVTLSGCGGSSTSVQQQPTIKSVTVKDITPLRISDGIQSATITSNGHIVAVDPSDTAMFCIYNGSAVQIPPTETTDCVPSGINNSGEVVGYHLGAANWAFVFENGIVSILGGIPTNGSVAGVLDNGDVVVNSGGKVLIDSATSAQTVNFPQVVGAELVSGQQIVANNAPPGRPDVIAYRYDGSKIVTLTSPASAPYCLVSGVNSAGYAVGTFTSFYPPVATLGNRSTKPLTTSSGGACTWTPTGQFSVLPVPDSITWAAPSGINDAGVIVGTGFDASNHEHALVWENGYVQDITPLLPTGLSLSGVNGIDDAGDILMLMTDAQGVRRLILATPTT